MKRKTSSETPPAKKLKQFSPIHLLPNEILLEIFSFVDNLFPLERTCKFWRSLILESPTSQSIWKKNYTSCWETRKQPTCWRQAFREQLVNQNCWKQKTSSYMQIIGITTASTEVKYSHEVIKNSIPVVIVKCFEYENEEYILSYSRVFLVFKCKRGKYPTLCGRINRYIHEWNVHPLIVNGIAVFSANNQIIQGINLVTREVVWEIYRIALTIDDYNGDYLIFGTGLDTIEFYDTRLKKTIFSVKSKDNTEFIGSAIYNGIIAMDSEFNLTHWDMEGNQTFTQSCAQYFHFGFEDFLFFDNVLLISQNLFSQNPKTYYYHYKTGQFGTIDQKMHQIRIYKDYCAFIDGGKIHIMEYTTKKGIKFSLDDDIKDYKITYLDATKICLKSNTTLLIIGYNLEDNSHEIYCEEVFPRENLYSFDISDSKLCFGLFDDTIRYKDFRFEKFEKGDVVFARKTHKSSYWPCKVIDKRQIEKRETMIDQICVQQLGKDTKSFWVNCKPTNIKTWSEGLVFDHISLSHALLYPPRGKIGAKALREAKQIIENL